MSGVPTIEAEFFRPEDRDEWDRFVAGSANGGLLHTRRFLDCHGARFRNVSLMFRDARKGDLIGVMPIVAATDSASAAISHAGSSIGGLVTQRPDPLATAGMFAGGSRRLQDAGFRTLTVVIHPTIFHRQPDDADQLFLTLASHVTELHLWSVIQVHSRTRVDRKRQAAVRAAWRAGLTVRQSDAPDDYRRFYDILASNLAERHQRKPVHSFDEVVHLKDRLGASARLFVAASADADTLADGWCVNDGLLKFKKGLGCGLAAQRRIEVDLADLRRVSDDWLVKHPLDR